MSTLAPAWLAADPVIPARDELLDPVALGEILSRMAGREVSVIERIRVKYRIGESLRVLARVEVDGIEELVALRTFAPDRLDREARRAEGRGTGGTYLPATMADRASSAVAWTLPNDRRLAGLARVLNAPGRLAPALRGRWAASEVVAWSPERCLTVRCLDRDGVTIAFGKCFETAADAAAVAARYGAIARIVGRGGDAIRVPRVIAFVADPALVVLEAVPGVPATGSDGSLALGRTLGALHGLPAPPLARFARLRVARIERTAVLIGQARPDHAVEAAALARSLRRRPPASRDVLLHGDVHSANVLVEEGRATLIDFDQCGVGPAATDLGSALARHLRDRVAGRATDTRERAAALLEGYASVGDLPSEDDLRWHTAASLLAECGMRAVNRLHEDVLPCLGEVLAEGRRHLEGAR